MEDSEELQLEDTILIRLFQCFSNNNGLILHHNKLSKVLVVNNLERDQTLL